ncbi:MAG: hypothetical protein IKU30_02235 [Clostridia bacterium]|nr:hypothetical protein [Clostridia bacterium]
MIVIKTKAKYAEELKKAYEKGFADALKKIDSKTEGEFEIEGKKLKLRTT